MSGYGAVDAWSEAALTRVGDRNERVFFSFLSFPFFPSFLLYFFFLLDLSSLKLYFYPPHPSVISFSHCLFFCLMNVCLGYPVNSAYLYPILGLQTECLEVHQRIYYVGHHPPCNYIISLLMSQLKARQGYPCLPLSMVACLSSNASRSILSFSPLSNNSPLFPNTQAGSLVGMENKPKIQTPPVLTSREREMYFRNSSFFTGKPGNNTLPTPAEVIARFNEQGAKSRPAPVIFEHLNMFVKFGAVVPEEALCLRMVKQALGDKVPVPDV